MDWIDEFMDHTAGLPSPDIFRLWSAISTVGGAMERRCWCVTSRSFIYPNTFILLIATPGIGKSQAIEKAADLLRTANKFHIAPSNTTKASLIDALAKADRKLLLPPPINLVEFHSLLVAIGEFGVLVPAHDLEYLNVLNFIYDCPRVYNETRRTLDLCVDIVKPCLNILSGTQPGWLASTMPEEAWTMGFTSRLIMIYSAQEVLVDLFDTPPIDSVQEQRLIHGLAGIQEMYGQFQFTDDAAAEMKRWHRAGMPPRPEHSKLQHYSPRRIMHMLKLCMISAASRTQSLVIEMEDLSRARDWLLGAEQAMPDIFREMVGKSDGQLIQEFHMWLWTQYHREGKPIHEHRLWGFLRNRVPAEKVGKIMDVAERSGVIQAVGPSLYTPRPKNEHGVE